MSGFFDGLANCSRARSRSLTCSNRSSRNAGDQLAAISNIYGFRLQEVTNLHAAVETNEGKPVPTKPFLDDVEERGEMATSDASSQYISHTSTIVY